MMRNNLFINRLRIVTDEGAIAYDENFHKGVNIIRGDNSSGKSTITHFIFFVLGGAFSDFVPEARKCSTVIAEVELNGDVVTLKRHLKDEQGNINIKAPLFFFWGDLNESLFWSPDKSWQKFGYNTTDNRVSFSSVLFESLDLPTVKGDNNITFHQILRLLYIDQESPTSSLFYYEHFDSQITRETVADLLLGVYNEELYDQKRRLIAAEKELEQIKSELKVTLQFFPNPLLLNLSHLKALIENKESEIVRVENEIIAIRTEEKEVEYRNDSKLNFQLLNEAVISQRKIVAEFEESITRLSNEITDSEFFIESLEKKIRALGNSIKTRELLGSIPLENCPECLSKILPNENGSKCKLCKGDIDESVGVIQARRMELEVGFQISESNKILQFNKRRLLEIEAKYKAEVVKLQQLQRQVNSALNDVKTYKQEQVDLLNNEKGFIEGEIVQYETMLENAEKYDKLTNTKTNLEKEVNRLKAFINGTERRHEQQKLEIKDIIKKEALFLLNNDLHRQDEFKHADEFHIDFSNNIAFLSNKHSKYSASSNFYLKVVARFSIFLASLSLDIMRYPRFIFADNMEDKGIELRRAQNLQSLLIQRAYEKGGEQFQMIYTTSYITEELNNSQLVVGEYYTKNNPSLKNIHG